MFVSTNTIAAVVSYYKKTLNNLYEASEIEAIIAMVFEHFLSFSKAQLLLKSENYLSESELLNFHFALKRLAKGEPIQYVLGKTTFYGYPMAVAPGVLIPRNETEELVDLIVKEMITAPSIIEIGTGSGCIAIALQKSIPKASVTALDISSEALAVAQKNATINQSEITFLEHDFLEAGFDAKLGENRWDCLVANPPYIPMHQKKDMHVNVLNYEPHLALFVEDDDPLIFYKRIAQYGLFGLKDNGRFYVEISDALGLATAAVFENMGYKNVRIIKDINANDRIVTGEK